MVGHSPPLYVHNHAQTWSSRKHWRLFCCCNQTKCWGRSNHEPRKPWKLIVQWLHLLFSCWWKAVAFLWPLLALERGPYLTTECVPDFPQRKSIFRNHHCDMLFILQTYYQYSINGIAQIRDPAGTTNLPLWICHSVSSIYIPEVHLIIINE